MRKTEKRDIKKIPLETNVWTERDTKVLIER